MSPSTRGRLALWLPLLAWAGCGVLLVLAAKGWRVDNRLSSWMDEMSRDDGYAVLREHFGGDETVVVRLDRFDPEDGAARAWIVALESRLRAEDAVTNVIHPLDAAIGGAGALAFDLAAVAARPLVQSLDLVAPAATGSGAGPRLDLFVQVRAHAPLEARADLARTLGTLRNEAPERGVRLRASGHPLIAAALDEESERIERQYAPAIVLLATLGTALLLGSLRLAFASLLPAVLAFACAWAGLRAAGIEGDFILLGSGPIAFVVLLAATLHLVLVFRRHLARGVPRREAARAALREKLVAGVLAALTTAAGFAVFAFSDITSVAVLGVTVALLVVVLVPVSMVALTPLLAELPSSLPPARKRVPRRRRVAAFALRRRGTIVGATALALGLGIYAGATLPHETSVLRYFPEGYAMRADFVSIERDGGALSTAEVLVRRSEGTPWSASGDAYEPLGAALAEVDGVRGVFGPDAVLRDVAERLGMAAFEPLRQASLRLAGRLDAAGEWARWTVRFATLGAADPERLVQDLEAVARDVAPAGARVEVTGSVPAMLSMQRQLVWTLARSLAWTLAATTLLLLVVVRSVRDAAAALFVNGLPVAVVLIAARLLDFSLDGGTVLVAALVLGMAVDSTFHVLHAAPRGASLRTRLRAHEHVAEAATVSTLALALGFLSLAAAEFQPVARFGILCSIGAASSLGAYLLVWPALWVREAERRMRGARRDATPN